jgi:tetratricopeptide (TPR) repeat protein
VCPPRRTHLSVDTYALVLLHLQVKRRTHQTVEVPALPNQEVFQTLIDLQIEEREGGYGDRSGKKNERYIGFLEADLIDYPEDPRTLYYLGYAHFDIFQQNKDDPKPVHWDHLKKAVEYMGRRAKLKDGNMEEKWFANLKLGEIYERFYRDYDKAHHYYDQCTHDDPERADAWFYIGQRFRLSGENLKALPGLMKASSLPIPQRSLFQWHYLYNCLVRHGM